MVPHDQGVRDAYLFFKVAARRSRPVGVDDDVRIVNDLEELKKETRPGDIYLTAYEKPSDRNIVVKAIAAASKSPFTHAGVVDSKGRAGSMLGRYDKKKKKFGLGTKYRSHSFRTLGNLGASVLILRPSDVKEEVRKQVGDTLASTGKQIQYSYTTLLRHLFPPKLKGKEEDLNKLRAGVCTLLPALKYPHLKVRDGYSKVFIRPKDFVNNNQLKQVVLYRPSKIEKD